MSEADAIRICSSALVLLGEEPIESFTAGTAPSVIAAERYGGVRDTLLGGHPWNFNRFTEVLSRRDVVPPSDWSGVYALPPGVLRLAEIRVSGTRGPWELAADGVWVNAGVQDEVVAYFHGICDEAQFRASFRQALIYRLAGEFAVAVTEDDSRSANFMQLAELELRRARHLNATEQPQRLPAGRFAALRRL